MQTSFDRNALILLGVFTLFLVSSVSAEWNIEVLDQPHSFQDVSNATNTVQIVELTDGTGTPINESQLTGDSYFQYKYNGSVTQMDWLNNGYWYADFNLNTTGGQVEFEAEGETKSSLIEDSTTETNATRSFNLGNMSVDLMNDLSDPVNPENNFDIKINVTDTVNNVFEDQAEVDFYFTNGTWTSKVYNIDNKEDGNNDGADDYYKNFGLNFDLEFNSDYVLHVNATNTSNLGYDNPFGVQSMTVETFPEIEGEIVRLNASSGCDQESFFSQCERDADIKTSFNITTASAENVNLTLELKESSTGDWENQSTTRLIEENGLYSGEITVPDINTSKYEKEFRLHYNASNGDREEIVTRNIEYRDFRIVDKSDAITSKGSYRVKLEIRKYFTPQLLTNSRIGTSEIEINQPSGETLTTFSVNDMERLSGSGHFKRKIDIPLDAETGIYDMSAEVTNLYDETKTESFSFNVTEVQKTFTLNDGEENFEQTIDKTGNHTFNVTVENDLTSETNISSDISENIEGFTQVNEGENIILEPEESRNVSVRFEIDSVDEYSGEIRFMDEDANYNSTLDVGIDHLPCSFRNGSVCIIGSGLNESSDGREDIIKDFTAVNYGELNESYDFSFSLSGNITDYATLGTSETTLNTENDSEDVNLTYTVNAPGFYSGTLEVSNGVDTVEIPVSLDSNVDSTSAGIEVSESIDLGEVQEEDSASTEIEIENTGDVDITSLGFTSDEYTVSADSTSVSVGSTETVSVDFSDITSESGQLTVDAGTDFDSSASGRVSVSASIIPDYSEQADNFEQRVIDLDSQVSSDSEYQTELNNAQSSISDLRSAYRQGNYDRAQTMSTQIQNTLDTVEREVAASQSDSNPSQPDPGQTNEGGGLPILPIAAVIFVILVVGFVGYTSVEFEKGDPLYNVLGK